MALSTPSLSFEQFRRIADDGQYNLIPIHVTVDADLETPVSAFLKIQQGKHSFLLESVEGGERQARYSFIGTEPFKVLEQNGRDPLLSVESELLQYHLMPCPDLPTFTGGAIGYITYDCVSHFETKVPMPKKNPLNIPESIYMFCKSLVVFDHLKHTIRCVAHIHLDHNLFSPAPSKHASPVSSQTSNGHAAQDQRVAYLKECYSTALTRLRTLVQRLAAPLPLHTQPVPTLAENNGVSSPRGKSSSSSSSSSSDPISDFPEFQAPVSRPSAPLSYNVPEGGYEKFVHSLKEHILAGDIIQAVPSQRCARKLQHGVSAFDIYRHLRVVNPSPYMFFLDLGNFSIVGASPEQLLKVDENRRVTTHPIAGTRKRGKNEKDDDEIGKELLANEKERAEHIMLVDLGRNDLGKVCTPGTVKVDSLMHIEKYSHVMHIVSHVSGTLSPDKTPYDAFRSVFPAGTVSGAPKVKAMQLISELENERRGVYAGSVGYMSFSGVLDTAIAIRTLVVQGDTAYLQAGAGIVYDSVPEDERMETVNKMKALAVAIDRAEAAAAFREYHSTLSSSSSSSSANTVTPRANRRGRRPSNADEVTAEVTEESSSTSSRKRKAPSSSQSQKKSKPQAQEEEVEEEDEDENVAIPEEDSHSTSSTSSSSSSGGWFGNIINFFSPSSKKQDKETVEDA